MIENFKRLAESFVSRLPQLIAIVAVLLLITLILKIVLWRVEVYLVNKLKKKRSAPGEYQKRMDTITGIINKVVFITVWVIGLILLLGQVGVNIGPILTAAGVLGLALSFGAQSLVKDLISGIFIIAENQIRVGDVAVINGTGGLVEAINLRTVVMRDLGGVVHIFPNGSINTLSNLTKEWSGYVFEIGVAYKEKIDRVIDTIKEVGASLKEDEEFGEKIIDEIEVFGLDKFADSALVIKGRFKTQPLQQWAVGREFNRRIKKVFDEKGIEIPFPHQSFYFGSESDPVEILLRKEGQKDKI